MPQIPVPTLRWAGPGAIAGLVVGYAVLWFAAAPAGQPSTAYLGQFLGAEAVLLLSAGLILISTLPWVEVLFDGIDKAAIWHRRVAITGIVLLIPHIAAGREPAPQQPRAAARRHRHGRADRPGRLGCPAPVAIVDPARVPWSSARSPQPPGHPAAAQGTRRIRAVASGAPVHRAVRRRRVRPRPARRHAVPALTPAALDLRRGRRHRPCVLRLPGAARPPLRAAHDYQVNTVLPTGNGIIEISLKPLGRPVNFAPGQFAMLFLEGLDGWHRHPFTITSAPADEDLRFSIKALGDGTAQLPAGRPAGDARRDRRAVRPVHPRQGHPAAALGRRAASASRRSSAGCGLSTSTRPAVPSTSSTAPPIRTCPTRTRYAASPPAAIWSGSTSSTAARDTSPRSGSWPRAAARATPPERTSVFLCGPIGMVRGLESGFRQAGGA